MSEKGHENLYSGEQEAEKVVKEIARRKYEKLFNLSSFAFRYINASAELGRRLGRGPLTMVGGNNEFEISRQVTLRREAFSSWVEDLDDKENIRQKTGHDYLEPERKSADEYLMVDKLIQAFREAKKTKTGSVAREKGLLEFRKQILSDYNYFEPLQQFTKRINEEIGLVERLGESGQDIRRNRKLPNRMIPLATSTLDFSAVKQAVNTTELFIADENWILEKKNYSNLIRALSLLKSVNLRDLPYDAVMFIDPAGIEGVSKTNDWAHLSNNFDPAKHLLGVAGLHLGKSALREQERHQSNLRLQEMKKIIENAAQKEPEVAIPILGLGVRKNILWP